MNEQKEKARSVQELKIERDGLQNQLTQLKKELSMILAYEDMINTVGWNLFFRPRFIAELQKIERAKIDFNGFGDRNNRLDDRQLACLLYGENILKTVVEVDDFVKLKPNYENKIESVSLRIKEIDEHKGE